MNNHKAFGSMFLLALAGSSIAQTPGRIVITQLGSSSAGVNESLNTNTGNTIQLLELRKVGSGQTATSIGFLPTDASTGVVMVSNSTAEGNALTRSSSGRFLSISGYPGALGTSRLTGTNRAIARFDFTGGLNTTTRPTNAFSGTNFRSTVTSDTPVSGSYRFWMVGANEGLRVGSLNSNTSVLVSNTATNLRTVDVVNGDVLIGTGSAAGGAIGIRKIAGLEIETNKTMTQLVTASGHNSPYGFAFIGDVNGTVHCYVADDGTTTGGVYKYTSTNGMSGPFTLAYRVVTSATRALCTDGKVLYGVSTGTNNNQVQVIWDGGSLNDSFAAGLQAAVSANRWVRGIALAPEPTVVDSDYRGGDTPGNIMTLRSDNGAQRRLRVGFVPDSNYRAWTDLATVNYDGHAVKTALDTSGNIYIAIQSETAVSGAIVPIIKVIKVPAGGGNAVSSSEQTIPEGYDAFGITVDSSNQPIISYKSSTGVAQTRFARWSSDLSTATVFDNTNTGWSIGSKSPVDISSDPNGYLTTLFASGNTLSTLSFDNSFSAGSATSDVTVADDAGVALTPLSAQFGTDGKLRVLSVGSTTATRALLRVDTLAADRLSVETLGQPERRDATGTSTGGVTTRAATSPSFLWAWGLSMAGNNPRVLMTGTAEPTAGPSGPGSGTANRNDNIIGSGRVWTFSTANVVSNATYRFAPGFSPVN
jgi:hypothetical protein